MSDTTTVIENEVKETTTEVAPITNPFDDNSWSTTPIEPSKTAEKETKPTTISGADSEEIVDELEYLEKQTGFKSWEEIKTLKTEAEQLRLKAQTPAEIKYANEESRKLYEALANGEEDKVYSHLDKKRKLSKAADMPAADAIKLHLHQLHEHYSPQDVDDVFEEKYELPKKPVQGADEDKEVFDERMTEYNTRVAKVNRAIERDAITAKAELAKQITELVPPEIPKRDQGNQVPSQEVLEQRKAFIDTFLKSIPKELENFKGFDTVFKDDTVEIPISYMVTSEEIKAYQNKLESFANANLDVNTLFSERWVNKDGTVNASKAAADLYVLDNLDKILQKVAKESGNKRLAHQMKLNSNIKVNGEKQTTQVAKPDEKKAQVDYIWQNG